MKLNKKFLKVLFLSLSTVFVASFSVSASIKKEKAGSYNEHFVMEDGLNLKDEKSKSGLDLLERHVKKDLKTGAILKEEDFEKQKKELVDFYDNCIEEKKLNLEELKMSMVKAKNDLDDFERLKKEVKDVKYEDVMKDYLSVKFLYKNTGMEKTKDASFKDLDELMKDNKTSTKHRVNLYIVLKHILERANLKKEEIEKVLVGVLGINTCGVPEKITGNIFLYSTSLDIFKKINEILKNVDVKNIEISEDMFEKAKVEINKYYDRYIEDISGSYEEWKEVFEKGDDKKVIELLNKRIYEQLCEKAQDKMKREKLKKMSDEENKRKANGWKEALKKGREALNEYVKNENEKEKNKQDELRKKLMSEDIILSEEYKKDVEEEYEKEKHKEDVLDKKYKEDLKEGFGAQENDLNSFKTVKEAVNKLSYSDVKDLNKDLMFDLI